MKTQETSAFEFDCDKFAAGLRSDIAVTPELISEFLTEALYPDNMARLAKKYITEALRRKSY